MPINKIPIVFPQPGPTLQMGDQYGSYMVTPVNPAVLSAADEVYMSA
ncbi:MAG: hypothetical protein FWF75_07065 [Propionibacteriaceae bacterium]|nr:hypothetical protein [Propionibacteriaceae bacterium]